MKKGTEQTLTYSRHVAGQKNLSLWTTGITTGKGGADQMPTGVDRRGYNRGQ
jgi:hypothetical protein